MALTEFTLASLRKFRGGRLEIAFDQAVRRLVADMMDRPTLKAARTLSMNFTAKPVQDERGDLDFVDLQITLKESIPDRKTNPVRMAPRMVTDETGARQGMLTWNDDSPDDPRQQTFEMTDDEDEADDA